MTDSFFMQIALALADEPEDSPSPNPRVGAILVQDGSIIARGAHVGPGQEHAEELAIRAAGPAARGSTLYCTLEPCSHCGHGKHRPPCAPLVVQSGIRRAVIAHLDPNPCVRGNGVAMLERAGIEVIVGESFEDAIELNAGFNTWMALGRPFIHLKLAQSLDGRIAAADGSSGWITDIDARKHAHRQRGRCDAVVVGIGTVLADDPQLTVRHGPPRHPAALILDSHARLPLTSRLVRERAAQTILVVDAAAPISRTTELERAGVSVLRLTDGSPHDLTRVVRLAGSRGIRSLYVEGGGTLVASFLKSGLYDRLTSYVAPVLLGGPHVGLDPTPAATMDHAIRLEHTHSELIGNQAVISGYRPGWHAEVCAAMRTNAPSDSKEVHHVHGTR